MRNTSYHKVKEHRGAHRVWVENQCLIESGFVAGALYEREADKEKKVISLKLVEPSMVIEKTNAKVKLYTVTGTKEGGSIIDLSNKTVSDVWGDHKRVRAEYLDGVIIISLHHVCRMSDERVSRFKAHLAEGTLTEGTFCAGIGVSTLAIHEGFKKHGIGVRTDWILDRDSRFTDIAKRNNPAITHSTAIINGSMEEIEADILTPVDIFQISMSCKVHSKASRSAKKRDVAEDHGDAAGLFGLFKSLEKINAALIISENVKEAMNSASYLILKAVLVELGYKYVELILNNSQSGSFENRERYWLIAVDANLSDIDVRNLPIYPKRYESFSSIMENFAENDPVWRTRSELNLAKIERDIEKGNGFSNTEDLTPDSTKAPCVRAEYTKAGSTDVRVAGNNGSYRMLTPREHAMLKSIPLSMIENVGVTLSHYVMGQSVDFMQAVGVAELACISLCGIAVDTTTTPVQQPVISANKKGVTQVSKNNVVQLTIF